MFIHSLQRITCQISRCHTKRRCALVCGHIGWPGRLLYWSLWLSWSCSCSGMLQLPQYVYYYCCFVCKCVMLAIVSHCSITLIAVIDTMFKEARSLLCLSYPWGIIVVDVDVWPRAAQSRESVHCGVQPQWGKPHCIARVWANVPTHVGL